MKLRIKGNSIRLRLLRSEVETFSDAGMISEEVCFGANALRYSLRMSDDSESIRARFANNEIEVLIPRSAAREWTENEEVGFESEQAVGDGEVLTIVVEKDFVCIDRPNDPDRADAFPNPNITC